MCQIAYSKSNLANLVEIKKIFLEVNITTAVLQTLKVKVVASLISSLTMLKDLLSRNSTCYFCL